MSFYSSYSLHARIARTYSHYRYCLVRDVVLGPSILRYALIIITSSL